ncbi:MAG: T9SS type A sorting domain-containing protein [Melioribacteraceae bacterium]|nr:T9SS type A sorting domain-containing protein [Melioribacteraceae bacterium]
MKQKVILTLIGALLLRISVIAQLNYTEDFNSLNNWTLYGSPLPQHFSSMKGKTGVFDNNGDSNNNSGGVSKQTFDLSKGFTLESEVYLDFTNTAGCWAGAAIGISDPTYQSWGGYNPWINYSLTANGDACWGSDPSTRPRTRIYINYKTGSTDSDWANFGGDSSPIYADQYANGWHVLKIVVDQNRIPSFYIDNNLVAQGTTPIYAAVLNSARSIWLGDRSSGSAGKAYHNYVNLSLTAPTTTQYTVVTSSNPSTGGITTGHGNYNSGSTVTVTATANSGYTFTNWTENGTTVSSNISYSFTINSNRTLVANFQQQSSSNPSLKPIASSTTVAKGSEFWVEVKAGDPNSVTNLFGVSFKLTSSNSNCTYVDGSAENGGFLGTGSSVLFFPQRVNDQTVDIGLSKISGSGVNGSGLIARAKFNTSSNITSGQTITFSLSDISATNATGQTITFSPFSLTITVSSTIDVWPGDCNNDKAVNSSDIMRIGLYYGQTKPGTNNAGSAWQAYAREPWSTDGTTPTRVYADANGDGAINSADIIPVGLNYAKVHSSVIKNNYEEETLLLKTSAGATVKPIVPISVKRNTPFQVEVKIGDPTPIQNLFGISLKLQSNKSTCTYVDGSALNGGFLGTGSSILFFSQKVNDQTVDIGLSKTSGLGINGAGIIASAQFNSDLDQAITFSLVDVVAIDQNGNSIQLDVQQTEITVDVPNLNSLPVEYTLYQNFPNPFNPTTLISYSIPVAGNVSLKVYDLLGNEVSDLVNEYKNAGNYEIRFNGSQLSSGVYFYKLCSGNFSNTKKFILMK